MEQMGKGWKKYLDVFRDSGRRNSEKLEWLSGNSPEGEAHRVLIPNNSSQWGTFW